MTLHPGRLNCKYFVLRFNFLPEHIILNTLVMKYVLTVWNAPFLGASTKFWKATISIMSVCPSVWNNTTSTGLIFMKFHIWGFFWKPVWKIQVELKSDQNNLYFMWRPMYVVVISCWIILKMRNFSGKNFRENQSTHFMCSKFFFLKTAGCVIM